MSDEDLRRDYQITFDQPRAKRVLGDLIAYCYGRKTTFDPDPRVHAFREGQRDVLMRISEFTHLSLDEIYRLRGFAQTGEKE